MTKTNGKREKVMVSKKVVVNNETGLHARPASSLVSFVKKFKGCTVYITNGDKKENAASIINVLTLGAKHGTELEVTVEGENEAVALDEIVKFIETLED